MKITVISVVVYHTINGVNFYKRLLSNDCIISEMAKPPRKISKFQDFRNLFDIMEKSLAYIPNITTIITLLLPLHICFVYTYPTLHFCNYGGKNANFSMLTIFPEYFWVSKNPVFSQFLRSHTITYRISNRRQETKPFMVTICLTSTSEKYAL